MMITFAAAFRVTEAAFKKKGITKFIEILKKRTSQALETKISGEFY